MFAARGYEYKNRNQSTHFVLNSFDLHVRQYKYIVSWLYWNL